MSAREDFSHRTPAPLAGGTGVGLAVAALARTGWFPHAEAGTLAGPLSSVLLSENEPGGGLALGRGGFMEYADVRELG